MKCKILSNFEAERLEMIKIGINSDNILIHHLKKMVSDILWKSFSNYKYKNSLTGIKKISGTSIGFGLKMLFGNYIEGEYSNELSKIFQSQPDIDDIEHKMYLASKKILKEECSELFIILKINAEQGLFAAISYSLRIQIEISKRV